MLPFNTHAGEVSAQEIGYEIVGQVLKPSAQQSLQYGYPSLD